MTIKPNKQRNIRTFNSLKNPVFRLYYIGMAGQWASMNMQGVARSLLIYRISRSGAILGLSALVNAIPTILFSLYGGALADRMQKKDILLFSMIGAMVFTVVVGLALTTGYLSIDKADSWWILMVTATIQGAIMGLLMPSRQAIVAEIVDREQVLNAVSLNTMGMNAFRILAPAATGFLIKAFDFSTVYYISGAMYGLAAFCMFFMPKTTKQYSEGSNAFADIVDGVRYIRREKTMLLVVVATLFVMICGLPFMHIMPMITEDILKVGEVGLGILLSVSGIGAIVGSLMMASLPNRKRGTIMLVSGIIMGLALVAFGFSSWWTVSIIVVIFIGLGQTGHRVSGNALAQNYTPPEYRGRVMSFIMMGIGFSGLGTFFIGTLAEAIGIQWSLGSLAILLVVVSLALLTLTPRLRRLE